MNKIDKLLYGGFGAIALVGIVVMLVSVFSPPKQIVEETDKTPKATVEKPIEDAPNQMDRWRQGVENARLQREQSEAWAKLIQAEKDAERAAQEELDKARKEWWESRQEWIERFPFEPTFHQEIKYDPNVYDARGSAHWPEEKKDEAFWDMMRRVQNHGFLRHFYASYLPYTEEFEQMYNIIKEEFEETDNTIVLGWTFETLKDYHKAAQHDSEEIYMENARVENEPSLPPEPVIISIDLLGEEYKSLPVEDQNILVMELTKDYMKEHMEAYQAFGMPSYEVRDITWRERAENLKEGILGPLMNPKETGRLEMEESVARAIQERLLKEIPAEGFLEMGEKERLCYVSTYESELKPGDPLLIK